MNTQHGFTILELMAIVAITGILLTVGLPSFQTLMFNNRITSQLNQLSSSLALARSEAVKLNRTVVVCPSTTGTDCTPGVDWDVGWITFIDRNHDASSPPPTVDDDSGGNPADDPCAVDAGDDNADDCILSYIPALQPTTQSLRKSTAGDFIAYNGLGASNEATMFVLCDSRDNDVPTDPAPHAKAASVSTTGRVSIRTTKLNGDPLTCDP